ncbi:hypothetical protein [Desulfocastanea catecholica]
MHLTRELISQPEPLRRCIEKIFEEHTHQDEVIIDLYKMILPEWNDIEQLHGHPVCGRELWFYICELFIEFDKIHHPRCMAGGAWINYGFSVDAQLEPWAINLSNCLVTYKET